MKILFVTPYYYPAAGYGGTPRAVYALSLALTQRGHQVAVWTTDTQSPQKRITLPRRKIGSIEVHYFKNISNCLLQWVKFPLAPGYFGVARAIKRYDLIHLHELRTFANILIAREARRSQIPYVLTAHGSLAAHNQFSTTKQIFDSFWGKNIVRNASALLALTDQEAQQFLKFNAQPKKIYRINNGVELSAPSPQDLQKFCATFKLAPKSFILFLGRLHPIKGLDFLLKVFFRVKKHLPEIKLVLAGPDEKNYAQKLKKQMQRTRLENDITFTGHLSDPLKNTALKQAAVFVYPSRFEAFPLAPFEALAQKTPVIISDRCGIAALFRQKKLGQVIAYGDVTAWAQAIAETVNQTSENVPGQERASAYVRAHLTWEQVARQHEKIYAQVISS